MNPQDIVKVISKSRFVISDEKKLQEELGNEFSKHNIPFKREKHLDPRSIPDFNFGNGVYAEVKIKGGARDIYRQCERYVLHEHVKVLILVTTKAVRVPPILHNKPIIAINLSRSWF